MDRVVVATVVLYVADRVLLQHRDDFPHIVYPGKWGLFGGSVEAGEEPEAGAIREIAEELELRLTPPLQHLGTRETATHVYHLFAAPLSVPLSELVLCEGQGMALFTRQEAAALDMAPTSRALLEAFWWPAPSEVATEAGA